MERQLTVSLSKLELVSFDDMVSRYLSMDAEARDRRLRRMPISVAPPIPAGILAALNGVKGLDGMRCDERIVLIALLETGLPVMLHAFDKLRAIPEPKLTFRSSQGFDILVPQRIPGIPLGDLTLLNRVELRLKGHKSGQEYAAKVALIAGIAHSKAYFTDELNQWATEVTCRFLAMGKDAT